MNNKSNGKFSSISDPNQIGTYNNETRVVVTRSDMRVAEDKHQQQRQRPKRKRKRVILSEDDYLNALEAIIQRDFFPSLESTTTTTTITTPQDADSLTERGARLCPSIIVGADDNDDNNGATRQRPLLPGGAAILASLSLEEFFSRYQSDDNASFSALQEREVQEHLLQDVRKRLQRTTADTNFISSVQSAGLLLENGVATEREDQDHHPQTTIDRLMQIQDNQIQGHKRITHLEDMKRRATDLALLQERVQHKRVNYANTGFNQMHPPYSVDYHLPSDDTMGPPPPQLPPGALRSSLRPYSYVMTPDVSGAEMTPVSGGERMGSFNNKSKRRKGHRSIGAAGVNIQLIDKKRSRLRGGRGSGIFGTTSSSSRNGGRTPVLANLTPAARELALRLGGATPSSSHLINRSRHNGRKKRRLRSNGSLSLFRPALEQQQHGTSEKQRSANVRNSSSNQQISGGTGLTDGLLSHEE